MSDDRELPPELDVLAEEFVARERAGEQPTISEYIRKYPDHEAGIREVFPLMAVLEGVGPDSGSGTLPRRVEGVLPEVKELGDYHLLREIGRGGMGVVYEAEQKTLGRHVALKVLPPHAMLDERFVERFRIEAQAAAKLQHPHIVPVIGLSEDDGVHYYTMQYIDGAGLDEVFEDARTLVDTTGPEAGSTASHAARLFARKLEDSTPSSSPDAGADMGVVSSSDLSLPISRGERRRYYDNVARIGLQAAGALAFAHARGVLHRDVKPSNIILDERGVAWVTDFGLCREEGSEGVTQTGDLVGTVRYMAPECFQGESDVRSDVYGLGITLYELLALAPAFEGVNRAALIKSVTQDRPARLRTRNASIPEDLATIVEKAIAPDREVRYQTAEELVSDLEAYLEGRPIAARAPSVAYLLRAAVRRNRPLALTVLAAFMLLVVSSIFYVRSVLEKERAARYELYAASISAAETALRDGEMSRARDYLETAPAEHRNWEWEHLRSRITQTLREFPTSKPSVARRVAYSPDGRWIAVSGENHLSVFDDRTGERAARFEEQRALSLAWSADGTKIHVGSWNTDKTDPKDPKYGKLITWSWSGRKRLGEHLHTDYIHALGASQDGRRLFVGGDDLRVVILDVESQEERASTTLNGRVMSLQLAPDERHVAAGLHNGDLVLLDAHDLSPVWQRSVNARGIESCAFVGDDLVAVNSYAGAVRVLERADGSLHRTLSHPRGIRTVCGAPDGRTLITGEWSHGGVHVWNAHTGERLYEARTHGRPVSWLAAHPDGTRFVSSSWNGTLKEWDVTAGSDAHILGRHIDGANACAVHPDGRLAASGGSGALVRVWDLTTGEIVRVLPGHPAWVVSAAFSPDGRYLATGDNGKSAALCIWSTDDWSLLHRLRVHKGDVARLRFLHDSRTLVSAGFDSKVICWDVEAGALIREMSVSSRGLRALALRPDGRQMACGGAEKKIFLMDTSTWVVTDTLEGHASDVYGLAYHPNGGILASVSADETIRIWDLDSREPPAVISEVDVDMGQHTEVIQDVTFHADGSRLFTADRSMTVKVWDWRAGKKLSKLHGHGSWVFRTIFDRGRVISCAGDGTVRVWGTTPASKQVPALRAARVLRERALPLVDRLHDESGSLDQVAAVIEGDGTLSDDLREAALRVVAARWGRRAHLKRWIWRILSDARAEQPMRVAARALTHALDRSSYIKLIPDSEATLLEGMAHYRVDNKDAVYYLKTSIPENEGRPEHQAVAMAFLVMSYAQDDRHQEADDWWARLEQHRKEHPAASSGRVRAFVAEAAARRDEMTR